jgi:hypothetical protein
MATTLATTVDPKLAAEVLGWPGLDTIKNNHMTLPTVDEEPEPAAEPAQPEAS